jgi:hypothetical protein
MNRKDCPENPGDRLTINKDSQDRICSEIQAISDSFCQKDERYTASKTTETTMTIMIMRHAALLPALR